MGITMFLQQKMNPPPPDPVQARLFQFMPIIFTFMMAKFPAGLIIYWSWNNMLSVGQQWLIQRRTHLSSPPWRGLEPERTASRPPPRHAAKAGIRAFCGTAKAWMAGLRPPGRCGRHDPEDERPR